MLRALSLAGGQIEQIIISQISRLSSRYINPWLEMLPISKYSREVLLEDRYNYRNEVEKCNLQRQQNFLSYLKYIFYNSKGRPWSGRPFDI